MGMHLMFSRSDILSKLEKMTEIYLNNLNYKQDPNDDYFTVDMEMYFTNMRVVLYFFASPYDDSSLCADFCRDETNLKRIKEILRHPRISKASDFVNWLSKVIKEDVKE